MDKSLSKVTRFKPQFHEKSRILFLQSKLLLTFSGINSTMIVSNQPVMLQVSPITLDTPLILDGSSNFMQKSGDSQNRNRLSSDHYSNENSGVDHIMNFFEKNYCLQDLKGH